MIIEFYGTTKLVVGAALIVGAAFGTLLLREGWEERKAEHTRSLDRRVEVLEAQSLLNRFDPHSSTSMVETSRRFSELKLLSLPEVERSILEKLGVHSMGGPNTAPDNLTILKSSDVRTALIRMYVVWPELIERGTWLSNTIIAMSYDLSLIHI